MHNIKQNADGGTGFENAITGKQVFVLDTYGRPTFTHAPKVAAFLDDFHGDTLNVDVCAVTKGSDGQTVNFAKLDGVGGWIRATTGDDAAASMAVNGVQIDGGSVQWKANAGGLVFEARLKLSAITDVVLFAGLTDQTGTLEMPATLSGTTLTTNATDAVGFLFDTAATTDVFHLVGVANNVDATRQQTTIAPVAAASVLLRVEVDSAGGAEFFIDGVKVGSAPMAVSVTPTVALTWVIAAFSNAAASRNVDVDFVHVQSARI